MKSLIATGWSIELIGEAANHIPLQVREAHPYIAWREMINLRNKLIHGYLGIDDEVVWDIVTSDMLRLLTDLESVRRS